MKTKIKPLIFKAEMAPPYGEWKSTGIAAPNVEFHPANSKENFLKIRLDGESIAAMLNFSETQELVSLLNEMIKQAKFSRF